MKSQFKIEDIVIFEREPTQDEWRLGGGYFNHKLVVGNKYTISKIVNENQIYLKETGIYGYPTQVFTLTNPLKIELIKLKETILTKRIRVTKEERRQFERLCLKLEIPTHKEGFTNLSKKSFGEESESGIYGSALIYFETDEDTEVDFKDLIEPFKKFRDEIL